MFLTLAIPTYHRPQLLYKALAAIGDQIQGRSDIGVLVLDDSDGAANAPWIERIRAEFPAANLTYAVNPVNLGIDENIKQCLTRSDSEYVWLLGEDDLLTPGAVARVVDALHLHQPAFLFANYIYSDDQHARFAAHAVLAETPGVRVVLFDTFAAESIWALGFIGGCVVRAADWRCQAIERYKGSYYSHVGGIIDASLGQPICVVGDILVLNRAEDVNTFTWSSSTFDVYFSFYEVMAASRLSTQPELLKVCERTANRLFAVTSLPWLAAKRADGVFNRASYLKYYASRHDLGAGWKMVAASIAVFPRQPLSWLRRIHLQRRFSRQAI